jgi:hypothetical protein
VAEHHRLSCAPVLVIDLRTVFRRNRAHCLLPFYRLCQCSNEFFPVPLARLCRSDKCVFVAAIHDAGVLSDIRTFQKRLAALGGDRHRQQPVVFLLCHGGGKQTDTSRVCAYLAPGHRID